MFFILTNPLKHILETLGTQKPKKNMTFFSPNLDFAWYFPVFLVRTPYTAADMLTTGVAFRIHLFPATVGLACEGLHNQ